MGIKATPLRLKGSEGAFGWVLGSTSNDARRLSTSTSTSEFGARAYAVDDLMSALVATSPEDELARQADRCRAMGSPFIARILDAADRQLSAATLTTAALREWPGDLAAAAVALRVNGALHALARRGSPPCLAALYRREHDDFDGAVGLALSQSDRFIADWIRHPTQTNEVARAAAIMSALMVAPLTRTMPFELLELGSSCGLNLNLDRYDYRLGSVRAGDPSSIVRIAPEWRGPPLPVRPVSIAAARGVDLQPLFASDAAHRERLLSFVWADQPARLKRLEGALKIATDRPPWVDQGHAPTWLAERLAEPQETGRCRAIVHTMVLQYLSAAERQHISAMMAFAGARATSDRPLIWIGFEWTPSRCAVELRLTSWPTGDSVVLARCHPYGDWLEWRGSASNNGELGLAEPALLWA